MSCCGSRRAVFPRTLLRSAPPMPSQSQPLEQGMRGDVLRYRGSDDMVLRGPFSGRIYRVSPAKRQVEVDPVDEASLLRSGLFVRV